MSTRKSKQNKFLFLKTVVLSILLSASAGQVMVQAQWTQPSGAPPPSGNVPIPLNLNDGMFPQIKDGPLMINASNVVSGNFGFRVFFGGIGIGSIIFPTGGGSAGDYAGKLHINNGLPNNSYPNPLPRPAIRIDGNGPVLVASSTVPARIGMGTLNPAYNLDIPNGTARIDTLKVGRLRIWNDSPQVGYVLTSLDNQGNASWRPTFNIPGSVANITPRVGVNPVEVIDQNWPGGITSTPTYTNLRPGVWQVIVNGVIGNAGNGGSTYAVTISIDGSTPSATGDKTFNIRNHPDGTAPFSVTSIIRNPAPANLNIRASDNSLAISDPVITGVSAYWMGN